MSLASTQPPQGGQLDPRLAEPVEPTRSATPKASEQEDKKQVKRGLLGFGKKKTEDPTKQAPRSDPGTAVPTTRRTDTTNTNTTATTSRTTSTSPTQTDYPRFPSSPGRSRALSSSPKLSSPAGSQIFERDVQESTTLIPTSPAIPSHIQTENYIPPVLDASSEAITDDHLNPDTVEIITHAQHQPAVVTVTGAASADGASSFSGVPGASGSSSWIDELAAFTAQKDLESASNYGSLDNTTDVRRLSFISFADVVQAEQAGHTGMAGSRESMHLAGLTSLASVGVNRSPSPIRSPISSTGEGPSTSPPTSKSGSVKGVETSPSRKPLGSPIAISPPGPTVSGEFAVETMSQALSRTGSGDLSGVRSVPTSPI